MLRPFRLDRFRLLWLTLVLALLSGVACAPLRERPVERIAAPRLWQAHFVAADGAVLPVRAWLPKQGPAKAVIVALHGFDDYSKFFAAPGAYLSARGLACYAYDQRGFGNAPGRGRWPGARAFLDDLRDFVAEARRLNPGAPLYILGESMGGAEAILAMTGDDPPQADGLILAAPAVWGRIAMPWYQRWLLESAMAATPWMELTGSGLHILASDNIEMLRGLGRDPLVIKATRVDAIYGLVDLMDAALERSARLRTGTLVLYGERDEVVPREPIRLMLAKMRGADARVAIYEQGYHLLLRDLQAQKPWDDILAWIGNRDAPLPSGADRRIASLREVFLQ
jgi:alpha-beta hydrolase superfamily lysophospholipase